jgi:hypothetical protein
VNSIAHAFRIDDSGQREGKGAGEEEEECCDVGEPESMIDLTVLIPYWSPRSGEVRWNSLFNLKRSLYLPWFKLRHQKV